MRQDDNTASKAAAGGDQPQTDTGNDVPEQAATATATLDQPSDTVAQSEIERLRAELEQATAKANENWELYLSTRADIENLRKRSERDLSNAHKFALEKFINELLPIKDSLELGISAASETSDVEKIKEGKALTLKMFANALAKFGVQEINPVGEKFNPELHEAMAMQPSDDAEPNSVLQVMQKGYLLNDRLVRPAMVILAQATQKTS